MISVRDVMTMRGFEEGRQGQIIIFEHESGLSVTLELAAQIYGHCGADCLSCYLQGLLDGAAA